MLVLARVATVVKGHVPCKLFNDQYTSMSLTTVCWQNCLHAAALTSSTKGLT